MDKYYITSEKLDKIIRFFIFFTTIMIPCTAHSVSFPWSTTFNGPDWRQDSQGTSPGFDGLGPYGGWMCSSSYPDEITVAANYPGGAGGKGFRHYLGSAVNQNGGGIRITFSATPEFWIRYYVRYSQNIHGGESNFYQKQMYLDPSSSTANGAWEMERDAHAYLVSSRGQVVRMDIGSGWGAVSDTSGNGDGQWHSYEWHMKKGSGSSDGVVEFWLDGVAKGSITNANLNGGSFTGWDEIIFGENVDGITVTGTCAPVDYDDIAISTTGRIYPIGGGGGGGGGTDITPDQFTFTDLTSASLSSLYTSNTIQIRGINSATSISISGNNGEYRVNSGPWTSSAGTVALNDNVTVRQISSANYSTAANTTLNVGGVSDTFTVTTGAQSGGGGNTILFTDGFESNNLSTVWGADWASGGETRVTSPVHGGTYSLRIPSNNIGSYVHAFGDNPLGGAGVDGVFRDDITVDAWYYLSPGFTFDPVENKVWILNAFENWGSYPTAAGQSKPNTFAPYYITVGHSPWHGLAGEWFGEHTRADGLGGPGELWTSLVQNVQPTKVAARVGQWDHVVFRVKLNTPGINDGIYQMWVNDVLICNYNNVNYRGTYTTKGLNHLMLIPMFTGGVSVIEYVYYDDIIISAGAPAGGGGGTPKVPNSPTNIRIQ